MQKSMKLLLSLHAAITIGVASLPVQQAYADSQGLSVPFPDVKSHWSVDSVAWAVGKNIVSGYEDGMFKPDKPVTEAEFLSMLIHGYKTDIKSGSSNWAEPYYKLSSSLNYPVDAQNINAHNEPITRIRVAELIASTQGMHYDGGDAIRYMYGKGLAEGEADQPTIAGFNGSKTLTRAEAVQFIKNMSEHGLGELLARPEQSSDTSVLPAISSGDADAGAEADQVQSGSVVHSNNAAVDNTPVLKLDDKPVAFKTRPVIQDGIVYFPIQEVCAAFGIGYKENSDGSITTTNYEETNTFRDGNTNHFVHYNPERPILGEEEIPLDGGKSMKKINGVFMMPAEFLDHIWFAVNNEATKFADMLTVTNGREDKSELKFYTYKQFVLRDMENMDGTNRQPDSTLFVDPSKIHRSIWVKEYGLPSLGTSVYATWRWNSKDSLYYKSKEIKFTGKVVDGVAKGTLSFKGDITYYQETDRLEQLKPEQLQDIELPYENDDIKMTWNDALNLFSKNNIYLPE
ncbi:S-layer homology domain-containing protein [Paenibacillus chitinolyticus]|uniref:S-layer homology domain-containing protein n=1 Tax=Paenibacillus chitinolyticus TaxID=79263 RepID=UPI003869DA64